MNSKQRYNAKRAAEHRERKQYIQKINRAFLRLSSECDDRVAKAITSTEYKMKPRSKQPEYSGSICIPQVALFRAGHRKSENITAR